MAQSRSGSPGGVVEIDRGSDESGGLRKVGEVISEEEFKNRADRRAGALELDAQLRQNEHPSTARANSSFPVARDAPLSSSQKERPLPAAEALRKPLSSRQKKDRNKVKNDVLSRTPRTERQAVASVLQADEKWSRVGHQLSEHQGELDLLSYGDQELTEQDKREVRRVDQVIARYEKASGREHLVYVPVRLPRGAGSAREIGSQLPARSMANFDKFTGAKHSLHELDKEQGHDCVVMEIQTRRGAYVGHSDSKDDTSHLLPRGMRFRITGTRHVTYETPNGETRTRFVVQARDITETRHERAHRQKLTKKSRKR